MTSTPLQALKKIVHALRNEECTYCLIGGHAASLYRAKERFTKDVDFALVASPESRSASVAKKVIKTIGLKPVAAFIPRDPGEQDRKLVCIITSAPSSSELTGLVDILLPEIPWVIGAVERAQANLVDLGFADVPVITPEDLIVAKCFSVRNSPDSFQDLDDLKELLVHVKDLDIDYMRMRLNEFSLEIPELVRQFSPRGL